MQPKTLVTCSICKRQLPRGKCVPNKALRTALADHLRKGVTDWDPDGFICTEDLNRGRAEYVQRMLGTEKGKLSGLEAEVAQTFKDEQLITHKLMEESLEPDTFGQRMADHVARFGGSWRFLIAFACFLALWIGFNIVVMLVMRGKPFDPFPFILLNLVLSCLASVQAPIIMMSQNRLEARDRKRAENDYKVNLKAELEIRNLHEKFDHLLEHQWQYLMEIQQIQVELLEELAAKKKA
ncbi:MAG: putative rane protein [Fibrobacteres bacterium]|nr:putative rane protein [Fibrobacterota bacterium]